MSVFQTHGGAWDRAPGANRLGKNAAWAAGAALATMGGQASAAVIVVNSLADVIAAGNSECTLREAVANANSNSDTSGGDCVAGAGTDTIDLSSLSGTITLGGTHLRLTDSTTVQGPTTGTLTIDANNVSRIFYVRTAGVNLTISRLTLTRGRNSSGAAIRFEQSGSLTINHSTITGNISTSKGGALFFRSNAGGVIISNTSISSNTASSGGAGLFLYNVAGTSSITSSTISGNSGGSRGSGIFLYKINAPLTINETTISGNSNAGGRGGALFFYKSSAPGTLTVDRSTISGNTAGQGAGFFFYKTNSTLRLENTTVSGNTATGGKGGGIYLKGSFGGSQLTEIRSSTIASNTASGSGGNLDGGNSANTINITNSIIAGGAAPTGPDINKGNSTINMNYSLLQDTSSAAVVGSNNVTGVDPQLGALANNGGTTLTMRIANASPARDSGSTTFVSVAATDQRGFARVSGSNVDMGAVEIGGLGTCGTAAGLASIVVPSANLCSVGSASAVTSTAGQYSWSCAGDQGTTAALCTASWSNTGGSGQGYVSAPTPGANNNWVLGNVSFAAPSGSLPAKATFPFGVTSLQLNSGTQGSTATVTINYSSAVPTGAVYMKFGKSPEGFNCTGLACAADHWYQMPAAQAVFAPDRRSVTLSIQDGGVGDNDLTANQAIVDPGGPVVFDSNVAGVPALSKLSVIFMPGLLALMAFVSLRRREDRQL